jgi:hypothetical protein
MSWSCLFNQEISMLASWAKCESKSNQQVSKTIAKQVYNVNSDRQNKSREICMETKIIF